MTSVSAFNPAHVFSPEREDTHFEREAIGLIDKDFNEGDTLTIEDALGQAGVKSRNGLIKQFTQLWRDYKRIGEVEVPKKDMFIMLFANGYEADSSIFSMVNNALCVRNSVSIGKVRKMLLGVIPALRSLPRVEKSTLFVPVNAVFPVGCPGLVKGSYLRCRSFVWACTEIETARRLLPARGTIFRINAPSEKKVVGFDLGGLVFPMRLNQVMMNPDLRVCVERVERDCIFADQPPVDVVHTVVDDSVLPLLEHRFPSRSAKELYDAAMALKAKHPTSQLDRSHVVNLLKQAKLLGCVDAAFQLSVCLFEGFGVVKNRDKAIVEITSAANNKNIDAMMWLGRLYKEGEYYKPDEALVWFHKALTEARFNSDTEREGEAWYQVLVLEDWKMIERLFRSGIIQKKKKGDEGGDRTFKEILEGALELAKRNLPHSMGIIGYFYMNGFGVKVSPDDAVKYLREAANKM